MATILVTHGIPAEGFSLLSGEKIVIPKPLMQFSMDELAALIPTADAVVACGALPGEIIRRGTKLRIIAGYGAGYDGVDVRAAAERGIPVTNLPDTVTDSTAELAIGLMLAVSRRIGENSLRAREEAPENLFGMGRNMGRSLRGQTLGLLGCGRIGKRTAEIAVASSWASWGEVMVMPRSSSTRGTSCGPRASSRRRPSSSLRWAWGRAGSPSRTSTHSRRRQRLMRWL